LGDEECLAVGFGPGKEHDFSGIGNLVLGAFWRGAPERKIIRRGCLVFFGWGGFLSGIQFFAQPFDFALKLSIADSFF
jgi:hypothetical protein